MDEMKLNLKSKIMRKLVSSIVSKVVSKKLGYKVNIQINEFDFSSLDGDTTIDTNLRIKLNSDEFKKIVSDIEKNI